MLSSAVRRLTLVCVAAILIVSFAAVPTIAAPVGEAAADSAIIADASAEFLRISGPDRYSTSVEIAKESYPGWTGIDHVVIASGEDRAAADPLAAACLCWAYDAPLLLVQSGAVPSSTRSALQAIKAQNPGVSVHVVGGPVSIKSTTYDSIKAIVGSGQIERMPYGDRYETGRQIIKRTIEVADAGGRSIYPVILVANGADFGTFFDALSLSAVSRASGAPLVLVQKDGIPPASVAALNTIKDAGLSGRMGIAGGQNTITEKTRTELEGWAVSLMYFSGRDRYETSAMIAQYFTTGPPVDFTWPGTMPLTNEEMAFAAKIPDALCGGTMVGRAGGPVVVVGSRSVPAVTRTYLAVHSDDIEWGAVLGGRMSVEDGTYYTLRDYVRGLAP